MRVRVGAKVRMTVGSTLARVEFSPSCHSRGASSGATPNPDPSPDAKPDQGRVERSWLSLDAEAMRPSVELHVDEEKAEASGVCLGLESLTKKGEFSSVMARNCTVTAIEDSFLLQFALEATNSVLVRDTSHPCPSP